MSKGFTLIEVLVTVLIIGILTSVALPHYQKAVMRSRFAQMVVANKAIYNAQLVYHDTFNKYADTMDELDISLPPMSHISCEANYSNMTICRLIPKYDTSVVLEQILSDGRMYCCAYAVDKFAGAPLCEAEMGTKSWHDGCGSGSCHCYKKQ